MTRFITILIASCAVAACSGYGGAALAGPHAADARNACRDIGLSPTTIQYVDCVGSLEQTAAEVDAQARADRASAECLRQELAPGTAAFANCVLDRTTANP